MVQVVRDAVEAGALGFSTNRLGGHRDGKGVCVPGTLGSIYEYTELAKGCAEGGGGIAQFVSDFSSYDDIPRNAMDEQKRARRGEQDWEALKFVSANLGMPVLLSMGLSNDLQGAMSTIDGVTSQMAGITSAGGTINTQTFIRPQALLTSWDCRSNNFRYTPTFKQLEGSELSAAELRATLTEPKVKAAILADMDDITNKDTRLSRMVRSQWNEHNMKWHYPMVDGFDYEPAADKSVTAIATASGQPLLEVLYDALNMDGGGGMTWRPLESYGGGSLDATREFVLRDGIVPGISDAGAHMSVFRTGSRRPSCSPTGRAIARAATRSRSRPRSSCSAATPRAPSASPTAVPSSQG